MWQPEDRAIKAQRASERAHAITVECRYCGAIVGTECFNPRNGIRLSKQAAHYMRLQDVDA